MKNHEASNIFWGGKKRKKNKVKHENGSKSNMLLSRAFHRLFIKQANLDPDQRERNRGKETRERDEKTLSP